MVVCISIANCKECLFNIPCALRDQQFSRASAYDYQNQNQQGALQLDQTISFCLFTRIVCNDSYGNKGGRYNLKIGWTPVHECSTHGLFAHSCVCVRTCMYMCETLHFLHSHARHALDGSDVWRGWCRHVKPFFGFPKSVVALCDGKSSNVSSLFHAPLRLRWRLEARVVVLKRLCACKEARATQCLKTCCSQCDISLWVNVWIEHNVYSTQTTLEDVFCLFP